MISLLRLDNIVVAQQSSESLVVGWLYMGVGPNASQAQVKVWRSYVEHDGFELVDTVSALTGFYRDESVNLHDKWRFPFYKLEVISGAQSQMHGPYRVNSAVDGVAINIIRNSVDQVRFGGNPVLVYQRRSDTSDRCSNCWDVVLRKVTTSSCLVCFNTGYEGGYYAPVLTLAVIKPEVKANAPGDVLRQPATSAALFANYPVLRPRDVVYEFGTGKRFRISHIESAEKHRMIVNQSASMEALEPADIENKLPVPSISSLVPVLSRPLATTRYTAVDNFSPEAPETGYLYI